MMSKRDVTGTKRPVIGINTTCESDHEGSFSATRFRYWQSILNAGGLPLLIPQIDTPELIDETMDLLDGFVFIGGYDIPGEKFGQVTVPTVVPIMTERETTDFALWEALLRRQTPVLAICLGFQELNIMKGGTLYQDILHDGPETSVAHYSKNGRDPIHNIEVVEGTRLAEIFELHGSIEINSSHHQAIGKLGSGLVASAHAPDGIIEAIELPDPPWCIGVQWHPELMADDPVQSRLFSALIKEAQREKIG